MKLSYNQDTKSFSVESDRSKLNKAEDEVKKLTDKLNAHDEKYKTEYGKLKELSGVDKQIHELKLKSLVEDERILNEKLKAAKAIVIHETNKFNLSKRMKQLKDKK
jgi:hypothetical protein